MGLLDFLKKAFNGESTLAGNSQIFGRNPGAVLNPMGVVAGLHDSSGNRVGTRFGNPAPVLERVLLDRTIAQQTPQPSPMPIPMPTAAASQPQIMPTPGMAPQAVPPGVPFNPPPLDQGTPLAPPPPPIHDIAMYAPPAQLHPGSPGGAPLAHLLQAIRTDPRAAAWFTRVFLQGQPSQNMGGPVPLGVAPGVNMETWQGR